VKIQIVSFICVCVQEKQSVTASVYLSSAITLGPWRQKGGRPKRAANLTTALGGQRSCYATVWWL